MRRLPARREPVAVIVAGGRVERGGAVPGGEVGAAGEPVNVADVTEQAGCAGRADAGQLHQPAAGAVDQFREFLLRDFDLLVDDDDFVDQLGGQPAAGLADHVARPHGVEHSARVVGGQVGAFAN